MRPVWALAAVLALACCATGVTPPMPPRDQAAPIGATTRFDAAGFSGVWTIASSLRTAGGTLNVAHDAATGILTLHAPQGSLPSGRFREGVRGELLPMDAGGTRLAIMWLSEDGQTAAVGAPTGQFAAIINRGDTLRPDRAAAARAVMAFYGWDIARLQGADA